MLRNEDLDGAMEYFQELSAMCLNTSTPSAAPRSLATQLVVMACRKHRIEVALTELESGRMQLVPEMLGELIRECVLKKSHDLAKKIERLCIAHHVKLDTLEAVNYSPLFWSLLAQGKAISKDSSSPSPSFAALLEAAAPQ